MNALPPYLIPVPACCALALVLYAALAFPRIHAGRRPLRSSCVWMAFQAVLLALFTIFPLAGMLDCGPRTYLGITAASTLMGLLAFGREGLLSRISSFAARPRPRIRRYCRGYVDALVLAAIAVLTVYAMERGYNERFFSDDPAFVWAQCGLVALFVLTAYFLGRRHGAGPAMVASTLEIYGLCNAFLLGFKGTVVTPGDVLAIRTAAAVASGYSYVLSGAIVRSLAAWAVVMGLCSLLSPGITAAPAAEPAPAPEEAGASGDAAQGEEAAATPEAEVPRRQKPRASRRRAISSAVIGVALLACSVAAVIVPDYREMGINLEYFDAPLLYAQQGSLLCFITGCQDFAIDMPAGYSDQAAQDLEQAYADRYDETRGAEPSRQAAVAQFEGQQPCIVAVMDETFADLSIYDGLGCGYDGPAYLKHQLGDQLQRGALSVSVFGGGTCNSEFEFLCGLSMWNLAVDSQPYCMYDFSNVDALPRQLKALGYDATAIHPQNPDNWNRSSVYEQMGFDRFISMADFDGMDWFHAGYSDKATYEKVLEQLSSSDAPQFVFDITMANHGGYTQGNIPADYLTNYQPSVGTADEAAQLNEYLSCVQRSDQDLQWFIGQLSQLDRPVILVYFGDHQPSIAKTYAEALFADDGQPFVQRQFQTVYTVWANYPVAGSGSGLSADPSAVEGAAAVAGGDAVQAEGAGGGMTLADASGLGANAPATATSTTYLAAQVLEAIGAPLSNKQKAELVISQDMPALDAYGAMSADGSWHDFGTDPDLAGVEGDLQTILYYEFIGKQ